METPREITDWLREKIESHRWVKVSEPRSVAHEFRRQMGGRKMLAAVTMHIEPSQDFSLQFSPDVPIEYQAAIRNATVSILLSQHQAPVLGCRIEVQSAVVDPNHSSYTAFFFAAKEATEQLIGVAPGCVQNIQW